MFRKTVNLLPRLVAERNGQFAKITKQEHGLIVILKGLEYGK